MLKKLKEGNSALKLSYSSQRYKPELDGVRGIAILMVMLFHCFPFFWTRGGWVGVDLFFVLSGFLITGILVDSKGQRRYYSNFIGRRILRIFPLYYLVLFLTLYLIPTFWGSVLPPNFEFYTKNQGWFWSYMQNWLFSFSGMPNNLLLTHFWSLAVEEQFYLVWPLLIWLLPRKYLLKMSLLLCMTSIVFRILPLNITHFSLLYRYANTFSRMDCLLIGGIIAQLVRGNRKILEAIAIPVGVAGLMVFMTGVAINKSLDFWTLAYYYTGIDLFMGMVLVLSLTTIKWLRRSFCWLPFRFLGKYSYGLYVYHFIIFILLRYNLGPILSSHFMNPLSATVVLGISTIVLSLVISVCSFHLFETQFLKLKSYFRANQPRSFEGDEKVRISFHL